MARDPRYDILFTPLQIGPVKTKNRFFQVPHCTGMGHVRPRMLAEMRGVKAEGGWGVVCTEYNSIHPSSDDFKHVSASLWDESDIRAHRLMTDKIHMHGALAGAELWYGGARSANMMTREVSLDLDSLPNAVGHPFQTRAMDASDIRMLRHWHRRAALRARDAGFDIVYVYATHGYLLSNFLSPTRNTRSDEYGGSLENRTRLVRELIEETKDAVGDRCAVAVRFAADEKIGQDGVPITGERREMFEMLADLPDLWDINIADYGVEMGVSRFTKEGALEPYMDFVKSVTDVPVVTVGRFTSPDTMVSQIKRGVTDLIGAARPSIADPFLPAKIEAGDLGSIRECIGCNVCYSGDSIGVPIRCTQNPTMGEEWRKGWHPEKISPKGSDARVLIVGAGPAGLEAARALGLRGYDVMLAEATRTLGGRVPREAALPGMSEYIRVRDYRVQQLEEMPNVEIFRESRLSPHDVHAVEADHVVIATGAHWRMERFDGDRYVPVTAEENHSKVFTPDDIMDGKLPEGPTLVYDEDGYYLGGVIAEKIRAAGHQVIYTTPHDAVSQWAENTSERWRVRMHLMALDIKIEVSKSLRHFCGRTATLVCEYAGATHLREVENIVMVTQRRPNDTLFHTLQEDANKAGSQLPFSLTRIGDCDAPAIIAAAVYAGHRYARTLDAPVDPDIPLRHDRVDVGLTDEGAYLSDAPSVAAASDKYLATLRQYLEEEIEGAAYFERLAERFQDDDLKRKMMLLKQVEEHTAVAVRPLIEKYDLRPRDAAELTRSGQKQADTAPGDWDELIAQMRSTFPGYIEDFRQLEAMAPPDDLPPLKVMTEHEVAALAFLEAEANGDPESCRPLHQFLRGAGG
ncbi:FAD-dependent oxidoreductase [Sulfitobacter aestuariivivens]|uniref:oxidoreductase n=1 Tax=Sulfitobacter aestuariivivens TaxID=2766981 RepID=UPI001FE3B38E|nr:FAD-dependent oxidoreductase [Sulfitobacter aestuariivivens]